MSDLSEPSSHLSDEDIRAYWRERLSQADERRVEEHYLDCPECQTRVRDAEGQSRAGTSRTRAWAVAATVAVGLGLYAAWPWLQDGANRGRALVRGSSEPSPSSVIAVVHLAPPTRNDASTIVTAGGRVIFALDAREAGTGGTRFDVTLSGPEGPIALTTAAAESSASGEVRVPVDASQLRDGPYSFELRSGSSTIAYSFLIRR